MGDIENNKQILEDMYFSILKFFHKLLTFGEGKYSKFYKKVLFISDNFPIYLDGKYLTSPPKDGAKYLYIDASNYKHIYKKFRKLTFSDYKKIEKQILNLIRNQPPSNPYVALEDFSFKYIKDDLDQLNNLIRNKSIANDVQKVLYKLRSNTQAFKNNKCVDRVIDAFIQHLNTYMINKTGNRLTRQQEDAISQWIKSRSVYLEGVPGASKTFIGASSLVLSAAIDSTIIRPGVKVYNDNYNYLILAQTYKALEEFIKKVIEIFTQGNIINFLKNLAYIAKCNTKENIGIKSITLHFYVSKDYIKKYNGNVIKKFKKVIGVNNKAKVTVSYGNCKVCNYSEKSFNDCIKITIPISRRENDDEIVFHLYVLRKFLYVQEDFSCITALHIEEASQMPFYALILVFNKLKNSCFFKEVASGEGVWRFSFSGDPLQLGPIYQKPDGEIDFEAINIYYNIFSYFFTSKKENKIYLNESFRVCDELLKCVERFYRDVNRKGIKAYKTNCCENIKVKNESQSKFYELFKKPIKTCILRVEYECNEKCRRENCLEIFVVDNLLKLFDYKDYAVLTLFRNQENLLSDYIKNNYINYSNILVGTVDKLQGDEKECVIFSMVTNEEEYIRDTKNFIFNPNRLNVAITRTQKLFVIVHSSEIRDVAFTDIDTKFNKRLNSALAYLITSNPYFQDKDINLVKNSLKKFLKIHDTNEGMYIFQEIVKRTQRLVGEYKFNDCVIKFYC